MHAAPPGTPARGFLLPSFIVAIMPTTRSRPATRPIRPLHPALQGPDVVRQIGQTPLIDLTPLAPHLPRPVRLLGKAEFMNPGGSVKDRPALRMVQEGLQSGALRDGRTLIDATSGNTGIAYAMLGAALGFPVTLALPANASDERKHLLRIYGADLILTDPMESTDGAQREVKERVAAEPERYFYPDQYNNHANWRAHYDGTGVEILEQTEGAVTHFVTGLGTTGTFVGVSRRLKEANPDVRCVSLQPDSPLHGLEGLKHLPTALVPGIYDADLADENLHVSTETAQAMTRRLARELGVLVGVSGGANVAGALRVAETLETGTVVTILCDTGMRYLSEDFWNQAA